MAQTHTRETSDTLRRPIHKPGHGLNNSRVGTMYWVEPSPVRPQDFVMPDALTFTPVKDEKKPIVRKTGITRTMP